MAVVRQAPPEKWPSLYKENAYAALREAKKMVEAALKEPDPVFHINEALGDLLRAKSNFQAMDVLKKYQGAVNAAP